MEENIFTSFVHVLAISRVFGLLQLNVPRSIRPCKRLGLISKNLWIFILVPLYTWTFYNSINIKNDYKELSNWLNNAIDRIKILLGASMLLVMVGFTPFRKYTFLDLLSNMREIDDELKVISIIVPYRKVKNKITILLYSAIGISFIYQGLELYLKDFWFSNVASESYHALSLYVHLITEMQFVTFVLEIESRLKALNEWLVDYHTSGKVSTDFYWVTPVGAMSSHLSVVSRIHDKLCIIARKTERMFAFRLLLIISLCFIIMTLKTYFCFSSLYKYRDGKAVASSTLAVLFDTGQIMAIVVSAAAASNEVNITLYMC